jgi:hypothetical protein
MRGEGTREAILDLIEGKKEETASQMESASLRKTFGNRIISPTLRRMSSGYFETLERGQRRCSTRPLAPWPFVVALHGVAWPLSPKTHENVQLKKGRASNATAAPARSFEVFPENAVGVKSLPDPGRGRDKSGCHGRRRRRAYKSKVYR